MKLFPAIDLYEGKAVRLYQGDYTKMTVYADDPLSVAHDFYEKGARHIHLVDLEGAKSGTTPNLSTVTRIAKESGLFSEIGGGIRSMEVVDAYLQAGIDRVILGTAAVTDETFLLRALDKYGEKIAVGADIRDGYVAIRGWLEQSAYTADTFCRHMESLGVKTLIITDISRDGAMQGIRHTWYQMLSHEFPNLQITASGGVSSLEDVRTLAAIGLYGAIIGKAYYTGAIDLKEAVEVCK